tara:strand:+ start:4265 stop:4780 length:516 start_codon:yes stop_codon:yes gene_type:complete
MAFTRPTTDQVNFRSSTTGTHLLDTYLEACEKGGFTLPVLMDNLFSSTGGLNANAVSFRVKPSDVNNTFQARFGIYTDPNLGWFDTNQFFFRQKGAYAAGVAYERLDMVQSGQKSFVCIEAHTGPAVIDQTKFEVFFDGDDLFTEISQFRINSEPRIDLLEEFVLLKIDVL